MLLLLKNPAKTISYGVNEICYQTNICIKDNTPYFKTLISLYLFWIIILNIPSTVLGDKYFIIDYLWTIHIQMKWVIYWLLLGILSSIGFGTGLHTGILYLFPWVINIRMIANKCKSLDFPVTNDNFICKENNSNLTPHILGIFYKTFPTVFILFRFVK